MSFLGATAFNGDISNGPLLRDHRAQADHAGPNGKTALMPATTFIRSEIAVLLLLRGANPFAPVPVVAARLGTDGTYAIMSDIVGAHRFPRSPDWIFAPAHPPPAPQISTSTPLIARARVFANVNFHA